MTAPDSLLALTDATLDDALARANVPVLLDLWAPWCHPCLAMAPVLASVVAACGGALQLAKLDVQQYPAVSARFAVRGIPTLILLEAGAEVARLVGPRTASELKAFLARHGVQTAAATALDSEPPEWGAFYGDESLRAFLLDRLHALAASGALHRARLPAWSEGQGSVSAALVRHANPRVFERVSGMPYGVACALEFAGLGAAAEVDDVLRSVAAGADLGHLAWDLARWWLGDPAIDWPAVIGDPAVEALRQRWLRLSDRRLPTTPPTADAWASLHADAGQQVGPRDPAREVPRSMAQLIEELSPPPASDDAQGWTGALLLRAAYLKYAATVLARGWSHQDLAYEGIRSAWLDAKAAAEPGGRFTDERLAAANAEWEVAHDLTAYLAKAAELESNWPQWQAATHVRIRTELTRLIRAARLVA